VFASSELMMLVGYFLRLTVAIDAPMSIDYSVFDEGVKPFVERNLQSAICNAKTNDETALLYI
jgi:hypothetical protein